ncbi:peptidoglycan-binding protein, partial [Streptomyces sp. NPDC005077]|uniref:peptidoglycan-binding domain-containing protein n=1 Tax=Streptomyces sp. NPDC005077 TaxID=3154292 RepID=UPI0033B9F41C
TSPTNPTPAHSTSSGCPDQQHPLITRTLNQPWPVSGLDCDFGPNTRAATIAWQSDRGLKADGEVGPQSFGRADNNLFWNGSEIRYNGSNSDLGSMYRNSAGRWYIAGSSSIVYLSYSDDSLCG